MAAVTDTTASPATELDVWARLLRAHATLTREFNASLQAEHGLTVTDYEALLRLHHAEGHRLRRVDLAERIGLTASGITRLLAGLEAAGLVDRKACASDSRVQYAVLTPAGHERLRCASEAHTAAVASAFEGRFEDGELELLARLLSRLPGGNASGEACLVS